MARTTNSFGQCAGLVAFACAVLLDATVMSLRAQSPSAGRSVEFCTDIMPILSKHGCNGGACHGSAAGRGNLKLSLFGGDPRTDYQSLVTAFGYRRINFVSPHDSLLLLKPTGQLPHGGDQLFAANDLEAEMLERWISQGAEFGPNRKLVDLRLSPAEWIATDHALKRIHVLATFEGIGERDVTAWANFEGRDPQGIRLEIERGNCHIGLLRPGIHLVQARFLDRVVTARFIRPFEPQHSLSNASSQQDNPATSSNSELRNPIDMAVENQLIQLGLSWGGSADECILVRRLSLDLTGRLPDRELLESYSSDHRPDRYFRLVERMLASPEFVEYWKYWFCKWFNIHSFPNESEPVQCFANWIGDQIQRDVPLDLMVHQLLTVTGDTHTVGPANYARLFADARSHAEAVAAMFMGTQLKCANCHNHPLDIWTQDDYHGLAAIFSKVRRGRIVDFAGQGGVTNPRTGELAKPKLPGVESSSGAAELSPTAFAEWLCSKDNAYFPRAMVNRIWFHLMGRGLFEPVDDFRQTNPASNEALLSVLTQTFVDQHFQLRSLLRQIVRSDAYRRAGSTATPDASNGYEDSIPLYRWAYPKRLPAEVWLDAIQDALELQASASNRSRAIQQVDQVKLDQELQALGLCRVTPGSNCSVDNVRPLEVKQALEMIQGTPVNQLIQHPQNILHRMHAGGSSPEEIWKAITLRSLNRSADAKELRLLTEQVTSVGAAFQMHVIEDWTWALFCSEVFRSSH